MYKLVLKVPEMVFIIFIFLPIFLIIGGYYPDNITGTILSMVGLITGAIWMAGVSSYIDYANGKKNIDWFVLILLSLFVLSAMNEVYQGFFEKTLVYNTEWKYPLLSFGLDLVIAILLTIKIRKVFYERSIWFIFFEVVFYGIGVATLTPEIKNHYRENRKKMDTIFAGDNDEELLH
jgi:hypothetical protein